MTGTAENLCHDYYDREFFDFVHDEPWLVFMNHGYYPERALHLEGEDARWKHQVALYRHVVAGAGEPCRGRAVDVGCGRGGGTSHLARAFPFDRVTGVEVSSNQAAFCARTHRVQGLDFVCGSAQALPFSGASLDVVVNVESLHCYPDPARFLDEVARVLAPGGRFACADIFVGEPHPSVEAAFRERFADVVVEDVTERVALSCLADSSGFPDRLGEVARRPATLEYLVDLFRRKFLRYANREHTYYIFRGNAM